MNPAAAGALATAVAEGLATIGDEERAERMQAYLKTEMAFHGVAAAPRRQLVHAEARARVPADVDEYRAQVTALWALPHREEKYAAIDVAKLHHSFVRPAQVDLYERLVVEGAWWDLVDDVAIHLIGPLVASHRDHMGPVLQRWVDGPDLWLWRTAIICQVGLGAEADRALLFDFCLRRASEEEFFVRKAIGWALRDHARTDPEAVRAFVVEHGDVLSGLSRREATRHL